MVSLALNKKNYRSGFNFIKIYTPFIALQRGYRGKNRLRFL